MGQGTELGPLEQWFSNFLASVLQNYCQKLVTPDLMGL